MRYSIATSRLTRSKLAGGLRGRAICHAALAFLFCAMGFPAFSAGTGHLYGVLEITPEHAASEREAGLQVAVVAVSWDKFEPRQGVYDPHYIGEIARQKKLLRSLGYKLQVDPGVQYPPAWIFDLPDGRYKNQYGDSFVSKESGKNLPNVVFNAAVRRELAAYFGEVFSRLGNDWDYVRLGCAKYGELNYPQPEFAGHGNCYWAFDDLAQGKKPGLPAGIVACPVPGWIPGTASHGHASASAFAGWYLDSLKNYQDWQITTVRQWYSGDICLLYGSWGLRQGWMEAAVSGDLGGLTPAEKNGEIQQGYDWMRMIGGIRDRRVIVYCTWMDGTLNNRDISDDRNGDPARWSPVHWQASLARANPIHPRVWGENTGRNNRDAMLLTFSRIQQFGLMGVMWAFEPDLFASPDHRKYATLADYAGCIRANE